MTKTKQINEPNLTKRLQYRQLKNPYNLHRKSAFQLNLFTLESVFRVSPFCIDT